MKKPVCKNCTFYHALYEKFSSGFARLAKGCCIKSNSYKKRGETCEKFKDNEWKEEMQKDRLLKALEQSLTSINEIAQILKNQF